MVRSINLVVLRCADLAAAKSFYEAIGLTFEAERHAEAPSDATRVVRAPEFDEDLLRQGAFAAKPDVQFLGRRFCVTGASSAKARVRLELVVAGLGGESVPEVRRDLDYLVVDAPRDVAWVFSGHARKVEQA